MSTRLAWLAGFLEGDGCFQIARVRTSYQYRVEVSQSIKSLSNIDVVEQILKTFNIDYKRYEFTNRKHPVVQVRVHKKDDVRRLLCLLEPYLVGSKWIQGVAMRDAIDGHLDPEDAISEMKQHKVRSYDIKRGGRTPDKVPASDYPKILEMREQGKTLKEIGDIYGVTKQAIHYLIKK